MERTDPQQARVYAAEAVLATHARRFASVDEARAFVSALFADDDLWDVFDPVDEPTVELEHRFKHWDAVTDGARIRLSPRTGMDAATVLHEVAHVLTIGDEHGPRYTAALSWLVRRWMGFHAFVDLERSYAAHGVLVDAGLGRTPGGEVRWGAPPPGGAPARW